MGDVVFVGEAEAGDSVSGGGNDSQSLMDLHGGQVSGSNRHYFSFNFNLQLSGVEHIFLI